jgi:hypothetical protein
MALLALAGGSAGVAGTARAAADDSPAALEHFEKKVRPLLVDNCYNCHSANTNAKGGLRVDDRNGLLSGGNAGKAVIPGKPDDSLLLKAVLQSGDLKMPPKKHLTDEQIADLRQWIADGAAWPEVRVPKFVLSDKPNEKYEALKKQHWAFQPVAEVKVPAVADAAWPKDDVDRFVLAKLEARGLKPTGAADRVALIRRVTFDLTGLPPTPEDVAAFVADSSAGAFEKVVDRLLASPAFGEAWGRHWLDVARFGESTGGPRNIPLPHAWRYRDYVIDAFNADKPFDRFVKEQIAGDLLPAHNQKQRDEQLVATGFLALGVKDVNQRFKVRFVMDNVDEQIDTVSRSVLGLTASCARCHDHKFDPIPQKDYYGLAGILTSTDLCGGVRNKMGGGGLDYYDSTMLLPIGDRSKVAAAPAEKVEVLKKELDAARAAWNKIRGTPEGTAKGPDGFPVQRPYRLKMEKLQAELGALTDPTANGPVAFGVRDAKEVADTELRVRGEAEKLGPVIPRGFLSAVPVADAKPVNPAQSGRLELAEWLANPKNPLTTRVAVNRAWHHLFGQGIVTTVDNFGVTGDAPSHPELLDHLATRFVADGWSLKRLVRSLVLTRTYQLSADASPEALAADPGNKLLWRHVPRRLTAEEIRDATLAASDQLSRYRPDGSPAAELPMVEQRNNGPEAARFGALAKASTSRSVYLPQVRGWVATALEVFDYGDQGMVNGSRDTTTVAPQALYLLNDPFVRRQAIAVAERVVKRETLDDAGRIDWTYRLTVGRSPTAAEVEQAKAFLSDFEATTREAWAAEATAKAEAVKAEAVAAKAEPATADAAGATQDKADPTPAVADATPAAGGAPTVADAGGADAKPADEKVPAGAGGKAAAKGKRQGRQAAVAQATAQAKQKAQAEAAARNGGVAPKAQEPTAPQQNAQVAAAAAPQGTGGGQGALPPIIDPDQIVTASEEVKEEVIRAADVKTAAWAAFAQALIGSAEFRYLK